MLNILQSCACSCVTLCRSMTHFCCKEYRRKSLTIRGSGWKRESENDVFRRPTHCIYSSPERMLVVKAVQVLVPWKQIRGLMCTSFRTNMYALVRCREKKFAWTWVKLLPQIRRLMRDAMGKSSWAHVWYRKNGFVCSCVMLWKQIREIMRDTVKHYSHYDV